MPKKENYKKSYAGREKWLQGHHSRPKQIWVWDVPPSPATLIENFKNRGETAHVAASPGLGHWEQVPDEENSL